MTALIDDLPPREREVLLFLYQAGSASPTEIAEGLPEPLSAQAIRTMLSRLEKKGFVGRRASGRGFTYLPLESKIQAGRSVLRRVVDAFFGGSPINAATALLGQSGEIRDDELEEIERLIAATRQARTKPTEKKR